MGAGERRDWRGLGREHRAYQREWAQEAGGAGVAGSTQCAVMSRSCTEAICVQYTASASTPTSVAHGNDDELYLLLDDLEYMKIFAWAPDYFV